jgi:hypothetical protein
VEEAVPEGVLLTERVSELVPVTEGVSEIVLVTEGVGVLLKLLVLVEVIDFVVVGVGVTLDKVNWSVNGPAAVGLALPTRT